jgi:predicted transcriptional regulator
MNQEEDELTADEIRNAVIHSLNYLMEEGMIVKEDEKYRLKTQEEIDKEIKDILND